MRPQSEKRIKFGSRRKGSRSTSPGDPGFYSDYYAVHSRNKHKELLSRKYSIITDEDESEDANAEKFTLKNYKRIFSVTVGYVYESKAIIEGFNDLAMTIASSEHHKNVSIITFSYPHLDRFVFLFDFGVVTMWGFEESEEPEIESIFKKNCKYKINGNRHADVFYVKKAEMFDIYNRNRISIESGDLAEKLSICYALAQNTILSHYENDVALTIEETKRMPIEMRDKGVINLTKKEISRNIGVIFMKRSSVNLNSDILGMPDIFWDKKDETETYYLTIRNFLEINKRIEVLNKRMQILKELYDVMNNEIKTQGKFRLEWIVVYLIVIEIFVSLFWKMLVKDILKLY